MSGDPDPAARATARLHRLARRAARRTWLDLALAAGVAVAGLGLMAVSLLAAPAATPLDLLLRVHAAGLSGLVAACWGAALAEQALLRRAALRTGRLLIARGEVVAAFAVLLSAGE